MSTEEVKEVQEGDQTTEPTTTGPVVVAGVEFEDGQAMAKKVWEISRACDAEARELTVGEQLLVFAILERHRNAEEKMQGGVKGMGWDRELQTFYVKHLDDEVTCFGITKAIDGIFTGTFRFKRSLPPSDAKPVSYKRPCFEKGCLVTVTNIVDVPGAEKKEAMREHKGVFYVDDEDKGRTTIRFHDSESAVKFLELDKFCDREVTVSMLSAEDELSWHISNQRIDDGSKGKGKKGKKGRKGLKGSKGSKGKGGKKNSPPTDVVEPEDIDGAM